jgi:hypothetical protein
MTKRQNKMEKSEKWPTFGRGSLHLLAFVFFIILVFFFFFFGILSFISYIYIYFPKLSSFFFFFFFLPFHFFFRVFEIFILYMIFLLFWVVDHCNPFDCFILFFMISKLFADVERKNLGHFSIYSCHPFDS